MPRKQTTKTDTPSPIDAVPKTDVSKTDKPPKAKKSSKPKKEEVKDVAVEEDIISDVEATTEVAPPKEGDEVVPVDLIADLFDECIAFVEAEVAAIKDKESKSTGSKVLRSIIKRVKNIKHKVSKTMKQKRAPRKSTNNANSGFLKPVGITKELAKFGGWKPEEEISRVSVTKSVCAYIKDNNLQNPVDRRQILPDAKLAKLLNYDAKKDANPLTYYKIQSHLKHHFIPKPKDGAVPVVAAV